MDLEHWWRESAAPWWGFAGLCVLGTVLLALYWPVTPSGNVQEVTGSLTPVSTTPSVPTAVSVTTVAPEPTPVPATTARTPHPQPRLVGVIPLPDPEPEPAATTDEDPGPGADGAPRDACTPAPGRSRGDRTVPSESSAPPEPTETAEPVPCPR